MLSAAVMVSGYSIIAIVTVDLSRATQPKVSAQACPQYSAAGHDPD